MSRTTSKNCRSIETTFDTSVRAEAENRKSEYGVLSGPGVDTDLLYLNIKTYPQIMVLMAKSLHTRYRTLWQIATNIGSIPATLRDL